MNELLYAMNERDRLLKDADLDRVAAYAIIQRRGKELKTVEQMYDICHARLGTLNGNEPLYVWNFLCKNRRGWKDTKDVQRDFLDYVVNRSPYKDVFLIKDIDYIFKNGMLCNVDVPDNLLAGALILVRSLWEWTYIPLHWKKLVLLGVNEDMALLAAHTVDGREGKYMFNENDYSHKAIHPRGMSKEYITAFLKHEPKNPRENFRETKGYSNVQLLWGNVKEDFFKQYKPKNSKKYESWGEIYTDYFDETLEPFAKFCITEYNKIMKPAKTKAKVKTKVKTKVKAPKDTTIEDDVNYLLGLLCVKNGFTLAEVRKYRKGLRDMIAVGEAAGWRWVDIKRRNPEHVLDFNIAINWTSARRFNGLEWQKIDHHIEDRELYNAN